MKLVSDQACPETWTCQIVTPNGEQPDLAALSRCVHEVGDPFVVRGVEVTVDGNLVKKDGRLALRIAGSGEVLSLVPISRKVQWSTGGKAVMPLTLKEKEAYDRIGSLWNGEPRAVRVVGPLVTTGRSDLPLLEVREFFSRG